MFFTHLFRDFDTAGGSKDALEDILLAGYLRGTDIPTYLDVTVDGELTSSQSTNHEETSTNTGVAATETKLFGDLEESAGGAFTRETLGLVDLGKHGISRLRNNGGSETSDQTRAQVDNGLGAI